MSGGQTRLRKGTPHSMTITFNVSGTAFTTISGSELFQRPERYDDQPQTLRAGQALRAAPVRRRGKGVTHIVTTDVEAALVIRDYCQEVGELWAGQSDPQDRADGRALLACARQINLRMAAAARQDTGR